MKKDKEQFKCLIYDLMMGSRNLEDYPVKESEVVTNEFEEGMYCDSAYNEVYDANRRVCERLDVEEDDDVEWKANLSKVKIQVGKQNKTRQTRKKETPLI